MGSDADAVEFVEVGGVDGEEFEAFDEGDIGAFGFLEDAVIKGEPAQVAVEEGIFF